MTMRALSKEEVKTMYINDLYKKRMKDKNEADLYLYDKSKYVGTKALKHKQRQPYWRAK